MRCGSEARPAIRGSSRLAPSVILISTARYPRGLRERSAKPPFVGSNPTRASIVFHDITPARNAATRTQSDNLSQPGLLEKMIGILRNKFVSARCEHLGHHEAHFILFQC